MPQRKAERRRWRLAAGLGVIVLGAGCARLLPYRTPDGIADWQEATRPTLSLAEKASLYQARIERWHQLPDGMIRYRFDTRTEPSPEHRGNYADGSFFQGIYLASQALRYAASGDPAAWDQLRHGLQGARLFVEVSGVRGLLARYYARERPAGDPRWRPSPSHPGYFWRSDVSKDQYAGFVHGLGVALAVVPDPEVRAEVAELAAALADHLIEHDLEIVDWDGERTTHGNLHGRVLGVPIGVNALIGLAIAKTAAVATGEPRYVRFYERLVEAGWARIAYWAHFSLFGIGNRGNDNMAYLALYPLLLLESDEAIAGTLRRGARRSWRYVSRDGNGFFAFVHAAGVAPHQPDGPARLEGREQGRAALLEFPERKLSRPVDLTREAIDLPRACLNTSGGLPRSREAVPLYLRPRGASLWASDPYALAGRLKQRGTTEFAGIDYLSAYWIARYHGFVRPDE